MMKFEFLPAFKGDCFLIHARDGGKAGPHPGRRWPGRAPIEQHLRPRLMELRDERGLDHFTPLVIDLVDRQPCR